MAEVSRLDEAYSWNISRLADAFGFHRDTVRKRLRDAGIVPVGTRNGVPVYSLKDAGPALFAEASRWEGENDPDKLPPTERRAWFQSENERIKLEQELRNLIAADEVAYEMSRLAKAVANTLDGLPDILERDAGLSPEALERVQQVVDQLREQMYQAVIADDSE